MIQIHKQKEPASLIRHRAKDKADYANYPEKDELRESLCDEQRGICCYCLGQIQAKVSYMKIDHFQCQEEYPELQLDYNNMLAACMGNEGQPYKMQHCDTHKRSLLLTFNPANPKLTIQSLIHYGSDGTISSTNEDLDLEINKVLNLNVSILKGNRKAALEGFVIQATKKHGGKFKKDMLQRWVNEYRGISHQNYLKPYCQVIVYWLQKRINRA